ncbi:hypothetical protein SSBR45G_70680 [Bradyrhizobium sp. SSBR45G]|nr:hypothetical protein SSBR45G_70680 [Bradyrhizobium sp. SSBR45G]GLH89591.1 hypothetical protein SSBR45R_70520 [Bradyrhizobium sp. SSBR45R]
MNCRASSGVQSISILTFMSAPRCSNHLRTSPAGPRYQETPGLDVEDVQYHHQGRPLASGALLQVRNSRDMVNPDPAGTRPAWKPPRALHIGAARITISFRLKQTVLVCRR